ncbi:ribonuclease J [Candidatus Peregrinibacteria bacterium]|jgi:ribonuclease J|nr:ribonuclease J [Candidatus Peregrinibacteria bacterium]MBT7736377.1 ribonuclease J [Candidatus Peregrinibacteria bacterium]
MDKLDAWMKRAFSLDKPEEISSTSKEKKTFSTPKGKKKVVQQKEEKKQSGRIKRHKSQKNNSNHNNNTNKQVKENRKRDDKRDTQQKKSPTKKTNRPQGGTNQSHQSTHKGSAKPPRSPYKGSSKPAVIHKGKVKIIPLGGLNEVGKNMLAIEYENDIVIVDMGFEFPGEDMLGIDYVIPDITYLEENKKRIRGVVITHGHLDHIGGIPYILPKLDYPPIYATKLTKGLIEKRGEEFKQMNLMKLHTIDPDKPIKLGVFLFKFFRVCHSIPDAVGLEIDTPIGKIVHTGDFKFDDSPSIPQGRADMDKIEALGDKNVLALFCESTNSVKPGHSMSEKEVGKVLLKEISECKGRIIVASFSSQIGRIQQILDAAEKCGRNVFISGRSMRTNMNIASELGYLKFKPDSIKDVKRYNKQNKTADEKTLIITTGSQGESVSALTRMANKEHPQVQVKKGDTIILSSSPIIGNERAIFTVINSLSLLGAKIIHNQIADVHTSGHGKQEELKKMINFVKPKYLIPIHGEYFMRQALGDLAKKHCNIKENNVIMLQNGDVLMGERGKVSKAKEKIETKYILIDGKGEGHIGSQVQFDREMMSQNGALAVLVYIDKKTKKLKGAPDVVSRGFIYMHESDEITKEIAKIARDAYKRIIEKNPKSDRRDIKLYIKQTVDQYTRKKLERRPLIIPLIVNA